MNGMVGQGKTGNRKLPVRPDSTAGLHARSCTLVAEAVTGSEKGISGKARNGGREKLARGGKGQGLLSYQ